MTGSTEKATGRRAVVPRLDGPVPADARARLTRALEESIEATGYRNTTITDIVRLAKASRRTFYRVFSTKDDVLIALMDDVNLELMRNLRDSVDPVQPWRRQIEASIAVFFDQIAARPAVHLCYIRDLPYLGEIAEPVIRQSTDEFADLICAMTDNDEFRRGGLEPATRLQALMVQGALNELVSEVLRVGGDVRDHIALAVAGTTALLSAAPRESSEAGSVS